MLRMDKVSARIMTMMSAWNMCLKSVELPIKTSTTPHLMRKKFHPGGKIRTREEGRMEEGGRTEAGRGKEGERKAERERKEIENTKNNYNFKFKVALFQ